MTTQLSLNKYFENMWHDYCQLNPQAQIVYNSLTQFGENIVNDHIAFRTFSHSKINIDQLAKYFLHYGYKQIANYKFKEKKLNAKHFEHHDPLMPKVFISELDLDLMSEYTQEIVNQIVHEIDFQKMDHEEFMFGGRPWSAKFETYNKLANESEYAAWVYAHGYRPNHFTVYINYLKKLNDIKLLNDFLKSKGFTLNSSGGEIKGSPEDYLEQSSTMANKIPVQFNEGTFNIPGCYYEFAKRYKLPSGDLFQGFVATSADKIFESTHF